MTECSEIDTIFAISTAPGKAAIAVIRLSGPASLDAVKTLAGTLPTPRRASMSTLRDPASGAVIDHALALIFPAPASFTGEDCAEFHVHGGRAIVAGLVAVLSALPRLRPAAPGEFTRRAFENGKMDLTRVEALNDLIDAETPAQRIQALENHDGALARKVGAWRDNLRAALALCEASFDFADEGDISSDLFERAVDDAEHVAVDMDRGLSDGRLGERIRDGFKITIAGPPNAGKSTLVNWFAKRDVAIVSSLAGTTRDVLEVRLNLGGYPVTLLDTAGIRVPGDHVETLGIERAKLAIEEADLVLELRAADQKLPQTPIHVHRSRRWIVQTKTDLANRGEENWLTDPAEYRISVKSGEGLDEFLDGLTSHFEQLDTRCEPAIITRARHRTTIEATLGLVRRFLDANDVPDDARVEYLRKALAHLGQLTGESGIEDLLDIIFADFCIGK